MSDLKTRVAALLDGLSPARLHELRGRVGIQMEDIGFTIEFRHDGCSLFDGTGETDVTIRLDASVFAACLDGSGDARVAIRRKEIRCLPDSSESFSLGQATLRALCEQSLLNGEIANLPFKNLYNTMNPTQYGTSISPSSVRRLYQLVRREKPQRTVEVGLAFGISAIAIGAALRDNGDGGRHLAIDPFQESLFSGLGVRNLAEAGLADVVSVVTEPDYLALPTLLSNGHRAQFVFIDGNHMADFTHVDVFYADRILDVGGLLILDDVHLEDVDEVVSFMLARRSGSYRPSLESSTDRMAVFRKTNEDVRTEKGENSRLAPRRRI